MPDGDPNSKLQKLYQQQRQPFDIVHSWAKNILKSLSLNQRAFEKIKPMHIFLTGNDRCGKFF